MKSKKLLRTFILFDLVILMVLLPYLLLNKEKVEINEDLRSMSGGDFVELSEGFVHYELTGPADGELVVLVHGFSVPFYIWDPTVTGLVDEGYRVLRYDLFGRGFSDRPKVEYDLEFFVGQIGELTSTLVPGENFHLIGLSMGAPIAASFANQNQEVVNSITLIAPEVLQVSQSDIFPMYIPLVGEWIVGVYLVPFHLPQSQLDDFYQPEKFPGWEEKYREQIQYKGFKQAILSTIRNLVKMDSLGEYEKLNNSGIPAFLIWGKEDHSVSYEAIVKLMQVMTEMESIFIDEAGHIPHYEKPDIVNPKINQFLQSHP
jgi:pimeloyl-ACP methyl ester carboxylesterase